MNFSKQVFVRGFKVRLEMSAGSNKEEVLFSRSSWPFTLTRSCFHNMQTFPFHPLVRIEVGDYCRLTTNCAVELTTCVRGECRCPFGTHPNPERNRCLKDVELNEPCSNHDECISANSICYRQCKCRTSHITSQDGKRCLPYATVLHQTCEEDTQCAQIPNSCCGGNHTCVCNNGHHDINSVRVTEDSFKDSRYHNVHLSLNFFQRCLVSARLNGPCDDDDNCVAAHSSCVDNKCECDEGFHEFRGKFCSTAVRVQISVLVAFVLGFLRLLV